jgi:hypothetical protein
MSVRSEEAMEKRKEYRSKIGRKTVPPGSLSEQVMYGKPIVNMYPTPRAADVEGGAVKNVQLENGHFFRENKKGVRWGVKLRDAVEMFPTPMARDHKDINFNTTWKLGNKSQNTMARQVLKNNKPGGKLNPNFVELLMGYPMNWTKIDPTE